jgi:hypothetical protein
MELVGNCVATLGRSIIFAIDVEPDARASIQKDKCSGLLLALQELRNLRSGLEKLCSEPVRFNWFFRFDPQIQETWGQSDWLSEACPGLIAEVQSKRDLSGIHTHFWKWDTRHRRWFNEFADASWRAHCLRTSIDGYVSLFGKAPIASRFGDRWLGNDLVALLRKAGFLYDLTVEPGIPDHPVFDDSHASAWLPDYRNAPRSPYQPSAADFLIAEPQTPATAKDPFWIVPVTTTEERWGPIRRFPFLMRTSRTMNLVLRPRLTSAHLSAELDRTSASPLVLVLRAGDLADSRYLKNFRSISNQLVQHAGICRSRFTTVDDAVDCFVEGPYQLS